MVIVGLVLIELYFVRTRFSRCCLFLVATRCLLICLNDLKFVISFSLVFLLILKSL